MLARLSHTTVSRDPQDDVDFAEALYADRSFMSALYNGLSEGGILVSQVGQALLLKKPAQTHPVNRNRAMFIDSLIEQGFVNIALYNEVSRDDSKIRPNFFVEDFSRDVLFCRDTQCLRRPGCLTWPSKA
jgi:hypothetical protein